ncbi:MAG: DUF922 domain-containing protein [Pedobacter sp.]
MTASKPFAQNQKIPRIKLTWSAFKKTENSRLPYIAYTAHKTLYKYRAIQKGNSVSLSFEVRIMLDTPNTVVNFQRLQNLRTSGKLKLLEHEQGHTDLAVIYGRTLYKQLSSQRYLPTNFKTKTRTIYLQLMKVLAEENRRYDIETEHGFNDEKQKIWKANIAQRLLLN